jgi:hypothetical protein
MRGEMNDYFNNATGKGIAIAFVVAFVIAAVIMTVLNMFF